MLSAAGLLYAAATAVIVLAPGFPAGLATLVFAGLAWMAATSTLAAELQLFLPAWVRARGLAIYTVTFTGRCRQHKHGSLLGCPHSSTPNTFPVSWSRRTSQGQLVAATRAGSAVVDPPLTHRRAA